jgi:HSP20 family molecular chaperone IbpA
MLALISINAKPGVLSAAKLLTRGGGRAQKESPKLPGGVDLDKVDASFKKGVLSDTAEDCGGSKGGKENCGQD